MKQDNVLLHEDIQYWIGDNMDIVDKLEFILQEREDPVAKAEMRFVSFSQKAKNDSHLMRMINLRTRKMKKPEKVKAWYDMLVTNLRHAEAVLAAKKYYELTGMTI